MRKKELLKKIAELQSENAHLKFMYEGIPDLIKDLQVVYPELENDGMHNIALDARGYLRYADRLCRGTLSIVADDKRRKREKKVESETIKYAYASLGLGKK